MRDFGDWPEWKLNNSHVFSPPDRKSSVGCHKHLCLCVLFWIVIPRALSNDVNVYKTWRDSVVTRVRSFVGRTGGRTTDVQFGFSARKSRIWGVFYLTSAFWRFSTFHWKNAEFPSKSSFTGNEIHVCMEQRGWNKYGWKEETAFFSFGITERENIL